MNENLAICEKPCFLKGKQTIRREVITSGKENNMSMFDEALRKFNLNRELQDWIRENPGKELPREMVEKRDEMLRLESLLSNHQVNPLTL